MNGSDLNGNDLNSINLSGIDLNGNYLNVMIWVNGTVVKCVNIKVHQERLECF